MGPVIDQGFLDVEVIVELLHELVEVVASSHTVHVLVSFGSSRVFTILVVTVVKEVSKASHAFRFGIFRIRRFFLLLFLLFDER